MAKKFNLKHYNDYVEHVASEWEAVSRNAQARANRMRGLLIDQPSEENLEYTNIENESMRAAFHCTHKAMWYIHEWKAYRNDESSKAIAYDLRQAMARIGKILEDAERGRY